jgi:hypothetical protein
MRKDPPDEPGKGAKEASVVPIDGQQHIVMVEVHNDLNKTSKSCPPVWPSRAEEREMRDSGHIRSEEETYFNELQPYLLITVCLMAMNCCYGSAFCGVLSPTCKVEECLLTHKILSI